MGIFDRKNDLISRLKVAAGLEDMGVDRKQIDDIDQQAAEFAKRYGTYNAAIKALQAEEDSKKTGD